MAVFILPGLGKVLPKRKTYTSCMHKKITPVYKNTALDLSLPVLPRFWHSCNTKTSLPFRALHVATVAQKHLFFHKEWAEVSYQWKGFCLCSGLWAHCQRKLSTCENRLQPEWLVRPRWPLPSEHSPFNRLQISAALFWFCKVDYVMRQVKMSQFLQNNGPLWSFKTGR